MKKLFAIVIALTIITTAGSSQILKKIGDKIKNKSEQKAEQTIDKTDDGSKNTNTDNGNTNNTSDNKNETETTGNTSAIPPLKVYQNYDFVPGDKILFEDHFTDDQDGEFPSHWELTKGQALLNKISGEPAFFLTEGNYVVVKPRMKTDKYLTDPFTVEFDYYNKDNAYGIITFLNKIDKACNCESTSDVQVAASEVSFNGSVSFSKSYVNEMQGENFINRWHHVAIAVKNHQLKVYVDQYRVLVVPDTKEDFYSIGLGGIGSEEQPIIFKNIRVAAGGNMNMIGKKFTESKIVTHGINFDVNKATIKPESMGTLNMIVQVMKDNPEIKFEVGGHTDSDGADDYNLKLSQQRADAVKDQLIKLGVDVTRLTAKGYGETKPISDNTSLEGKANNRRVEFVKM